MSNTLPKKGEFMDGKVWYSRKGSVLTLGLTDEAIEALGSIESIGLPDDGENFEQEDVILTIEGTHGQIEVSAPAAGNVVQINKALEDEPDMISEDPLESGWLIKMEVQELSEFEEFLKEESDEEDADDSAEDEEGGEHEEAS